MHRPRSLLTVTCTARAGITTKKRERGNSGVSFFYALRIEIYDMRIISLAIIFLSGFSTAIAQDPVLAISVIYSDSVPMARVEGKVVDKLSNEVIDSAIVILLFTGSEVAKATTNSKGEYIISGVPPGRYTLQAGHRMFLTKEITGVVCSGAKTTYVDLPLTREARKNGVRLRPVEE